MPQHRLTRLASPGLLAPLLLAAFVLLLVRFSQPAPPSLCLLGDTRAYHAGSIPANLAGMEFDATRMSFGVGRAALGGWGNLGEALVVGDRVFVRSTDTAAPDYYRLVSGTRFHTSSFAYVPDGGTPAVRLPLAPGQRVAQLWQELAARYPGGVLAAGYVRFERLHTIAVSRPAIAGLALARHAAHYFTEPMETADDTWTYVVMLGARQPLPAPQRDDPRYARLFAQRADGQLEPVAHALRLAIAPADIAQAPVAAEALAVGRVTGESRIASGELQLYPLYRLAVCEPAAARGGRPHPP